MFFALCILGEIRVAFVLYKNLGRYLSTENASIKLEIEALTTNHTVVVNSPVITAAVYKESSSKVYLTDPVMFTVKHIEVSETYSMCLTDLFILATYYLIYY